MIGARGSWVAWSRGGVVGGSVSQRGRTMGLRGEVVAMMEHILMGLSTCNKLILLIDKVPWLIGGEGVRTELSLPNVEKTIGSVSELTEDEAEDRLQDAIQEKFAVFGDVCAFDDNLFMLQRTDYL
ncbi:uncharacterized protein LOC133822220 [Humulus lupulus]|uniref:uncharacterized protein LOC133822220 n=1 Tax=Humulus lupulus TaxID=3486 RepID=UPI002B41074A|nr:uncharacterized protein LOC133822220 [Humulus lupulus]